MVNKKTTNFYSRWSGSTKQNKRRKDIELQDKLIEFGKWAVEEEKKNTDYREQYRFNKNSKLIRNNKHEVGQF